MPKFVRVYTGPDGNSVIEEREFELQEFTDVEGAHGLASATEQAGGISFRQFEPGYFLDFHTAPRRQYSITLSGEFELGAPDGTLKRYGPGTILLAEDLTGTGHSTRVIGNEPRFTVVIPLA